MLMKHDMGPTDKQVTVIFTTNSHHHISSILRQIQAFHVNIIEYEFTFCASRPLIRAFSCCSRRITKGLPYSSKTKDMIAAVVVVVVEVVVEVVDERVVQIRVKSQYITPNILLLTSPNGIWGYHAIV